MDLAEKIILFLDLKNLTWGDIPENLIASLIFSILTLISAIFWKKIFQFYKRFRESRNDNYSINISINKYLKFLHDSTLKIKHSWKIDGKSLNDLFIPIYVNYENENRRISILDYLKTEYNMNNTPRILLLGDAGSGKTVSLGYLCREISYMFRDKFLLPIMFSFSEIKDIKHNEDLIQLIVCKLEPFKLSKRVTEGEFNEFVKTLLRAGSIFLLLDGLDELEQTNRLTTSKKISTFLQTYSLTPSIISSRISVWKLNTNILSSFEYKVIRMSHLTPTEIRFFVSQWSFPENKSGAELSYLINNKPYLRSIAINPLMLTIISFLYSQPKRVLPDNRVLFYKECIDALFEKWDNAQVIDRANKFETIDKIPVLNELAYIHIINSNKTDEDIKKTQVISVIEKVMAELSRPIEKRELMLNEIVSNAELLIFLPPDAYKFPHRTFMEYFAANYFFEENNYKELLELYKQDKGKWEETLILFCGLNVNKESSSIILIQLLTDFLESKKMSNIDATVSRALVESARLIPSVANEILVEIEKYLNIHFNAELVENLGYIASNDSWIHHIKAREILLQLLYKKISEVDLITVFKSLLRTNDEEIIKELFKNIDRISFPTFIINLGAEFIHYAVDMLQQLDDNKAAKIIDELVESGSFDILFHFLAKSSNRNIKYYIAYSLSINSCSDSFFKFMDILDLSFLSKKELEKFQSNFSEWRWSREIPRTHEGEFSILLICFTLSEYIILDSKNFTINYEKIHPWLRYITSCFINEKKLGFNINNITGFSIRATKKGLKYYWQNFKHIDRFKIDIGLFIIFFYHLTNIGVMISLPKEGWPYSMGILSYFGMVLLTFHVLGMVSIMKNGNTNTDRFVYLIYIVTTPIIFVKILGETTRVNPSLLLLLGIITGYLLILLPIFTSFKILILSFFVIMAFIVFFSSYINMFGRFFPNKEIISFLQIKVND